MRSRAELVGVVAAALAAAGCAQMHQTASTPAKPAVVYGKAIS